MRRLGWEPLLTVWPCSSVFSAPARSSFFRVSRDPDCQLKVYTFFLHVATHLPKTLPAIPDQPKAE